MPYMVLVNAGFENEEDKEEVLSALRTSFDSEVHSEKEEWFDIALFVENTKHDLVEEINGYFEDVEVPEGWIDVYAHTRSGSIHNID